MQRLGLGVPVIALSPCLYLLPLLPIPLLPAGRGARALTSPSCRTFNSGDCFIHLLTLFFCLLQAVERGRCRVHPAGSFRHDALHALLALIFASVKPAAGGGGEGADECILQQIYSIWRESSVCFLLLSFHCLPSIFSLLSCRPWGEGADESILQDILAKDKDKKIKAVAVVHNETTTGAGWHHRHAEQRQFVGMAVVVVVLMLAWQSCTMRQPQVRDGTAADFGGSGSGTRASNAVVHNETTTGAGWHSSRSWWWRWWYSC
jgi:hypothetical protein